MISGILSLVVGTLLITFPFFLTVYVVLDYLGEQKLKNGFPEEEPMQYDNTLLNQIHAHCSEWHRDNTNPKAYCTNPYCTAVDDPERFSFDK